MCLDETKVDMLMDIIQRTFISCQARWAYVAATRVVVLS